MSEQPEPYNTAQPTPLQAISNVIELKPDRRYLLVFRGDGIQPTELERIFRMLHAQDIRGVGIMLSRGQELEVIEAPAVQEEEAQDKEAESLYFVRDEA